MPDGTIQDSRNPFSPQWGLLEVEDPDKPAYEAHANVVDPGNAKRLLDKGGPGGVNAWNRYIMFFNSKETTGKQRFKRGDRVNFEMTEMDISINGESGKIWVANILNEI